MSKNKEEFMFEKLSAKETSKIVGERNRLTSCGNSRSTCGMTADFRKQFSEMIAGESFIYPVPEGMTSREVSARIRGTCYAMNLKIRTKKISSGVLVVYKGKK